MMLASGLRGIWLGNKVLVRCSRVVSLASWFIVMTDLISRLEERRKSNI